MTVKLTMAQQVLLHDLAVLQDAGLISAGGEAPTWTDRYGGIGVDVQPTVTEAGRALLAPASSKEEGE